MRGGLKILSAGAMMKRLRMFCLLSALAALLGANVAVAEEQGPPAPVGQQGKVLGYAARSICSGFRLWR